MKKKGVTKRIVYNKISGNQSESNTKWGVDFGA
jgi:hypothetical protein